MCTHRIALEEAAKGKRRFLTFVLQLSIPAMFLVAGLFGAVAS